MKEFIHLKQTKCTCDKHDILLLNINKRFVFVKQIASGARSYPGLSRFCREFMLVTTIGGKSGHVHGFVNNQRQLTYWLGPWTTLPFKHNLRFQPHQILIASRNIER